MDEFGALILKLLHGQCGAAPKTNPGSPVTWKNCWTSKESFREGRSYSVQKQMKNKPRESKRMKKITGFKEDTTDIRQTKPPHYESPGKVTLDKESEHLSGSLWGIGLYGESVFSGVTSTYFLYSCSIKVLFPSICRGLTSSLLNLCYRPWTRHVWFSLTSVKASTCCGPRCSSRPAAGSSCRCWSSGWWPSAAATSSSQRCCSTERPCGSSWYWPLHWGGAPSHPSVGVEQREPVKVSGFG